jgi:leucyl-tRNA synthetase
MNTCIKKGKVTKESAETFVKILSPFAPHLCEEIWHFLENRSSVSHEAFPAFEESYLKEDTFEYPVSFNGKLRFKVSFPIDLDVQTIEQEVIVHDMAKKWIEGKQIRKVIVVPKKIINVVVS